MKRIVLATVVLAAGAGGVRYFAGPAEIDRAKDAAEALGRRAWDAVADNPGPVALALGTFLVTVLLHKARGKSLRESVEVAATRVTVVHAPAGAAESAVVLRAKARATRAQLLADQVGLQNRKRKLPGELTKAETDACYTAQDLADAEKAWETKQAAHDEAEGKLAVLRAEAERIDAELAEIAAELDKLAVAV